MSKKHKFISPKILRHKEKPKAHQVKEKSKAHPVCVIKKNDERLKLALLAYGNEEFEQAYKLFLSLADEGHPKSQYFVGMMQREGRFVDKSLSKAFYWSKKSAQQNDPEALTALG